MSNPKWQIGPVKLANGTEGHIDFVNDCCKSIAYTGRFKTYNGDWWAIHWDESGMVPNGCEGYGHNLTPPPKKTVRVRCWLNVYADDEHALHASEESALAGGEHARFACIKIDRTVTEGDGL